jgi:ABC-type bacteriocin/lantibiotic exporter with double-glycine peptidase domain
MKNKLIFRFLGFLRPYWRKGLFAFLFMLLAVGLQLPMPFLTKYLIDKVLVMKSFRILNIIGFVLIGVLLLRIVPHSGVGLCSILEWQSLIIRND